MKGGLRARPQPGSKPVSVAVSGKKKNLEKEQTGSPNGGASAKPWEKVLADHRLNLKEQECAQKNRQSVGNHKSVTTRPRRQKRCQTSAISGINSSLFLKCRS
jgi:hypothetical protein